MKKMLLITVLALAMVLAFGATTAFAKYAGFEGSGSPNSRYTGYVRWADANALQTNTAVQGTSPHGGYATTTIKCAVCHSAHRGKNKLLFVGDATCTYCHTGSGYGGGAVSSALISWSTANTGPHSSKCTGASGCHTGGVHGVGGSTYVGAASMLFGTNIDSKLTADIAENNLVTSTELGVGNLGIVAASTPWSNANLRAVGTGAVCSQLGCHDYSAFGVINAGADIGVLSPTAGPTHVAPNYVTGHRVIAAASAGWDANGANDFGGSFTNRKIAWKPVAYCNSCHDLKDDNNSGLEAFPHAIDAVVSVSQGKAAGVRTAIWLTGAANSADLSPDVLGTTAAGGSIFDGICLKCHRSATSGVGLDF